MSATAAALELLYSNGIDGEKCRCEGGPTMADSKSSALGSIKPVKHFVWLSPGQLKILHQGVITLMHIPTRDPSVAVL